MGQGQGTLLEREAKVTKCVATSYSFQWKPINWAIYTINESTGEFSIQSDWQNYSYRWHMNALGPSRHNDERSTLAEFLAYAGPDYIVDKLGYSMPDTFKRVLDLEASKKVFQEEILRSRREMCMPKKAAREIWDELNEMFARIDDRELGTAVEYICTNLPRPEAYDYMFDCPWESLIFKPSRDYMFCQDELLPVFQRHLRQEIERGA